MLVTTHESLKMTYLDRFRIVKLSGELQEKFDLPEFICADPDGMPFPEGQAFYRWLIDKNACQPVTAHNYLKSILPFLTFLWSNSPSLGYIAPAEQIRNQIRDYLREKLGYTVRPHRNGNFTVTPSKTITATSARLFLVALKHFYTFVTLKGWYSDINPMIWRPRLVVPEDEFTPKMPPHSGMTLPDEKKGRTPDTYFCVVSGDWQPRIIDDPNLPKVLLAAFTYPRDKLVVRILFESGARVSEVLALTIGDWRSCRQRERALATNKGSRGERVKEIWWSSNTSQSLRNYINYDRRLYDPKGRRLDDLPDSASLFVTSKGTPYNYADFYFHWRKACEKANLKITPHQARHWFVTMALHKIQSLSEEKRDAARQALIAYMGWKNPETIKAYDHHIQKMDFASTHAALVHLVETGDSKSTKTGPPDVVSRPELSAIPDAMWERLGQLLEDE